MHLDFDKCLGFVLSWSRNTSPKCVFSGGGAGLAEEIFWWALHVPAYRICVLVHAK